MEYVAITLESRSLHLVLLPDGAADLRAEELPPGADSVFERVDLSHGRVAFRVTDGRYLARHVEHTGDPADKGRAALHLVPELTQCAAFEEVLLPGGHVSLRGCDLRFLGVHPSGKVVADRVANGSWERFSYLEVPAPVPPVALETPLQTALLAGLQTVLQTAQPTSGPCQWALGRSVRLAAV
jgi:hypothetical protein